MQVTVMIPGYIIQENIGLPKLNSPIDIIGVIEPTREPK